MSDLTDEQIETWRSEAAHGQEVRAEADAVSREIKCGRIPPSKTNARIIALCDALRASRSSSGTPPEVIAAAQDLLSVLGPDGYFPAAGSVRTERLRVAVLRATTASTEGNQAAAAPAGYWWCPGCEEEVDSSRVTFQECHDACGHHVEWKDPPTPSSGTGDARPTAADDAADLALVESGADLARIVALGEAIRAVEGAVDQIEALAALRALASPPPGAARRHRVEHRIREEVPFWVAEHPTQTDGPAYLSRRMKGSTALDYTTNIHDALTFATKTECEAWIRGRGLPHVACEHLVISGAAFPAPSPGAPGDAGTKGEGR
jgi:hypothetical protein